jgi:hypothetical protein
MLLECMRVCSDGEFDIVVANITLDVMDEGTGINSGVDYSIGS